LEGPTRVGFSLAVDGGRLVVASVHPFSAAARAGIRPGQLIVQVNRREVSTIEEFVAAVNEADGDVVSIIVVDPEVGRMIVNYERRPGSRGGHARRATCRDRGRATTGRAPTGRVPAARVPTGRPRTRPAASAIGPALTARGRRNYIPRMTIRGSSGDLRLVLVDLDDTLVDTAPRFQNARRALFDLLTAEGFDAGVVHRVHHDEVDR